MRKVQSRRSFNFRSRGNWHILFGCLILLLAPNIKAEDDSDRTAPLERVASLGGQVVSWAEKGHALYIGQGDSLRVFDQADRDHPKPVAWIPLRWPAQSLAISGSKLWVAISGYNSPRNEHGVECFDVSDPPHPHKMKGEKVPDDVQEKFNDDSQLPLRIRQLSGPLLNVTEVAAGAGRIWVRDEQNGWLMVDVSDPTSPKLIGNVGLPDGDRPLALLGSLVYGGGKKPGLRVYDGDRPGTCTLRASVPVNGTVKGLSINGKIAFIATGTAGLVTMDIIDPARPRVIGNYATTQPCTSVVAQGNLAGIYADDLFLLDVSDPAHPRQKGKLWVSDMMTTETTVVEHPLAEHASLKGWTLGGKSLVLLWKQPGSTNGLEWFDLRNPEAPVSVKSDEEMYGPRSVITQNELLVAHWYYRNSQTSENFFKLYDLHDPAKPLDLGQYACFSELADYAIHDDSIYVADAENGLVILRLKQGTKP